MNTYLSLSISIQQIPWISLVMIVIIAFSGVLVNVTRNAKPQDLLKSFDGKTILWFRILYPAGIIAAFICMYQGWGQWFDEFNFTIFITGFALFVIGLILRWVAILSLKRSFTVKISILENHQLKTDGVYRWMRHPSYTGLLLYYFGLGLVMNNVISILLLLLVNGLTLYQRIPLEEKALSEHFGEQWDSFAAKTKRLIPGIF
ncbi:MAG: methyltransferase family protein [Bacteroidota bacterium]|jgi:protein-S-isoprenylcysteine O-methyltransferase Ste14